MSSRVRPLGDAEYMQAARVVASRVLARSVVNPDTGCREWQGGTSGNGYGRIFYANRMWTTHRACLEASLGKRLPANVFACHRCDNPKCAEVRHLFAGSRADNMRDASIKGRLPLVVATQERARIVADAKAAEPPPRPPIPYSEIRDWLAARRAPRLDASAEAAQARLAGGERAS